MSFARRNRFLQTKGNGQRFWRMARSRRIDSQLETLESRVLLSITATPISWNGHTADAVAGEYVIQTPLTAAQLQSQMIAAGLHPTAMRSLAAGPIGRDMYLVVDNSTPVSVMNWWGQHSSGAVTSISPNWTFHASLLPQEFNNAGFSQNMWGFFNNGSLNPSVPGADIDMRNAWDLGTGDRNIVVAVLDTGLDVTHPDLAQNVWHNPRDGVADGFDNDNNGVIDDVFGANFTTLDPNTLAIAPDNNIIDIDGHGTYVSGVIGALANNGAANPGVGINWNVQIMAVKVLDDTGAGTKASVLAGLNYVQFEKQVNNINIVAANLSLGGNFDGPLNGIGDPTGVAQIFVALNQLTSAGVIVTVAAGNEGSNNDTVPVYPADFTNNLFLTVAATNAADQLSSFSNYGSRVQLAAPGEQIVSTSPGGGYLVADGTSTSSPMVAGAVALLKSMFPSASASQIVNAILAGVDVLPSLQGKVKTSGRLNVFRAAEILMGNQAAFGHVDHMTGTLVDGWAFDPNLGVKSVSGYLLIDGATVVPFTTTISRTDVNNVVYNDVGRKANGGFRGFSVNPGPLSPGLHQVQVYINDVSQVNGDIQRADGSFIVTPRLIASQIIEGNQLPIGAVDRADTTLFSGWARDPNSGTVPIQVRIDIDGATVAVVSANQFHSNIVGNHKFTYVPTLSQGAHRVDFYALDDFTGQAVLIGTRTVIKNNLPISSPSGLTYDPNTNTISGYVVDPDSGFDPVTLQIIIDGQSGGSPRVLNAVANISDPAGFAATNISQPGNDQHGYSITLPDLPAGNHLIQLYAFDNETGTRVELLQTPVAVNRLPTGTFFPVNQTTVGEWAADVRDPDSPNTPVYYRLDIDNSTGPLQLAPAAGRFSVSPFDQLPLFVPNTSGVAVPVFFTPGLHTMRLFVLDNETLQLVQVTQNFFGVDQPNQSFIEGDLIAPQRLVTGTIDTLQTVNGISYFNLAQDLGISGSVTDSDIPRTASQLVSVSLLLDGNTTPLITTITTTGNRWIFLPETLTAIVPPGIHYVQIVALDSLDPVNNAPDLLEQEYTLLGSGELVIKSPDTTNSASVIAAATVTSANLQTISGTVQANVNDPVPASFGNLFANVNTETTFRADINNSQFVLFHTTPSTPGENIQFTINTPQLASSGNKTATISYFDPFVGILRPLASRAVESARTFNFVNRRLVLSGNVVPVGSLDAASPNGIAGWVRDADAPGTAIKYRLDYDNSIGQIQTASLTRNDLPFFNGSTADKDHGFFVTPPQLPAGFHTVKLYAIDPSTLQAVLIGQRFYTVLDTVANRRIIGAVEVFNGTTISGWVQDPDNPTADVSVKLNVDGSLFSTTTASTPRVDIIRNGQPVKGFTISLSGVSAGEHLLEVFGADVNVVLSVLLRSGSLEVGTPQIRGTFDAADFQNIRGWAIGAANEASPMFRIEVNGVPFQAAFTAPETTETFNGVKIRRFSVSTPSIPSSQPSTVRLYYIDPNTSQATLLATRVIAPLRPTIGSLDVVNSSVIKGWAWSPSAPSASVVVQLLIDGVAIQSTTAGLDRPNLVGTPYQGHAFQFNMPSLAPGAHVIQIRFRDPITGDYSIFATSSLLVTV